MILCLRTPPLALQAALRRSPELRGRPLVLGGLPHQRLPVVAVSEEARAAGVLEGMPLREAEQRCPQAVFQPVDVQALTRLKSAFLGVLYEYTPQIAPADADGFAFLQLDGLTLKWPERGRLLTAIAKRVEGGLHVRPALGVGTNLFVSRLAASRADWGSAVVVEESATADFLASLPISVLPLDEAMREYLDLLGLRTLGALRNLSRAAWQRQFGSGTLTLHDLAWGIDPRQLPPWRPPPRIEETLPLDPAVDTIEALQFVVRALTDRLGESLLAQALGTRRILIRLGQDGSAAIRIEARFAYPVTAPAELFAGVRARLLRARPKAPIERITLTVQHLEPAYARQPGLLLRRDGQQEALADAVVRLQEAYRPELIQRATRVESPPPLAARRFAWRPA